MNKVTLLLAFLLSLTANAQITPPAGITDNIILWLSPDTAIYRNSANVAVIGERVKEWHDISGNGFVFSPPSNTNRPKYVSYQNQNFLDFRSGRFLENSGVASMINGLDEFSIYMVIKSDDTGTDHGFLDSEDPDGNDEIICLRYDRSGANTGRGNVLKCGMQGNNSNNQIESQSNTQTTQKQALTLTWKQGEQINLYIDGVLNESSNNTIGTLMSNVQKIIIGKGPKDVGASDGWDGRIGTTIFYSKKMDPDTVSLVSGDLLSIQSIATGDWDDPSTWDCNCNPGNDAFVKINDGHKVSLTQDEAIYNVIINSSGELNLTSNNRRLSIQKNLTNYGTITAGNGEIRFNGTSAQLIDGTANTAFYDLTISNTNGVKISNGSATISNVLDITNGCFATNNNLTLLSNASRTARLAELSGSACITGDITMQRYVGSQAATWKYLTSAIAGTTIADFNDDFYTTGFTGANDPPAINSWSSIYTYDESEAGIIDSGFNAATNETNSIAVGQGFWAYVDEGAAYTIDVTGTPNTGTINLPISYTNNGAPSEDGWNMVGNPYPSAIDWDSPNITKTNVNAAIYIWNAELQQFASYIAPFGTNGGSNKIGSSQAFWMQANSTGASVQLTEACKTNADPTFLKQSSGSPLRIKSQNASGTDELIINFEPNATNGFDNNYDAEKLISPNQNLPTISSVANGIDCSINQLNPQEITIPIKILSGISGNQTITIENADLFGDVSCLILEDIFNNVSYDLTEVTSFSAYIYDSTQSARFLLHVGAPTNLETTDVSSFGFNDGKIIYTRISNTTFETVWKDQFNAIIQSNSNVYLTDSIENLIAGTYYLETTDFICGNSNVDTIAISEPNLATAVENLSLNDETKVWINNNNLIVTGKEINQITIRNSLGQVLFNASSIDRKQNSFNLSQLSTQVLIVTTIGEHSTSSNKVLFINNN